jgi:flavorubredoxin
MVPRPRRLIGPPANDIATAIRVSGALVMESRIDEIGAGIYHLSIFVPDIAPPAGLTFNHFLFAGDEPLLFHCGKRKMFPLLSAAVARVMPVERLRWLAFGHFEADECGSMNEWLAAAPAAQLAHGMVGCRVSISDMADREPRMLSDNEVIEIGGRRFRYIDTPHVPHGWDAGVMFEETTATLLCGDLFTRVGNGPAIAGSDIVEQSIATESKLHYTSLGPTTGATIRKLAALQPKVLATMHGTSFSGDGATALNALGDHYDMLLRTAPPDGK